MTAPPVNRHGRFSEVWQFSQDFPGTDEQQDVIVQTFNVTHGSLRHRYMKVLDHTANQVYKRSFLIVGFPPDDMFPSDQIAVAGVTGISFRASFSPLALGRQAIHELGHVGDKHLLTAKTRLDFMTELKIDLDRNTWNRNVQETYADAFVDWWYQRAWTQLHELWWPT